MAFPRRYKDAGRFLVVIVFKTLDRPAGAWCGCLVKRARLCKATVVIPSWSRSTRSPARRRFLEQTAVLTSATGFAAAGYGLLYGRQNVEVVRQRIRLVHVPVFEGFRIAQLSDVHIGLFTTADYIRHCVTITNTLKADLIVLAGDCICWDPRLNV
jgi:hypothetical protein